MSAHHAIETLFVLFTGLAFGSFVTLASWRLPRGEDIVVKPSRCPQCDTALTFKDLWPVISWLTSRGLCRHCKTPVSVRYPLTELTTASLFLLVYMHAGLTLPGILLALFAVLLMVMIVVDFEHYMIPDSVQLALAILGIIYQLVTKADWVNVAGGTFFGLAIGLTLHHGYRWVRHKEGLGFGDVKFLAVAGLWLGFLPIVPFLFFSGLFGVVTGLIWRLLRRGPIFPFGPALAMSLFLCVLYPQVPAAFWHVGGLVK